VCHALITTAATTFAAAAAAGAVDIMHHCHHLPLSLSIIATIHVTVDHLHHPSLPPPIISWCCSHAHTMCAVVDGRSHGHSIQEIGKYGTRPNQRLNASQMFRPGCL
jgi:hypothetical protein